MNICLYIDKRQYLPHAVVWSVHVPSYEHTAIVGPRKLNPTPQEYCTNVAVPLDDNTNDPLSGSTILKHFSEKDNK